MTHHGPNDTWFLAQLKPNSYKIAERNLVRQGFRTFLPLHEETRRGDEGFRTRVRPLFPGYMFVALDRDRGNWRAVNSTNGVTRLVSFGREPAAVPQELVRELMLRCDAAGRLRPSQEFFQPGDEVRVAQGAFTGFVATVERLAPERRIWVLMDLMGTQTRVAIKSEHVQASGHRP
jgi:transcriptional antiterminator RfaH